jgi:8-oxo-dGTP diphosphatase
MKRYVAGFLFNHFGQVALIRKIKPEWQAGFLNGIGGHIEQGETPLLAMRREFEEETGVKIDLWHNFVTVKGDGYEVHWFRSYVNEAELKQATKEKPDWYNPHDLSDDVLDNLHWLVPMANYKFDLRGEIWHDSPTC